MGKSECGSRQQQRPKASASQCERGRPAPREHNTSIKLHAEVTACSKLAPTTMLAMLETATGRSGTSIQLSPRHWAGPGRGKDTLALGAPIDGAGATEPGKPRSGGDQTPRPEMPDISAAAARNADSDCGTENSATTRPSSRSQQIGLRNFANAYYAEPG
ncbi:hypothetical protein PHYSODRAFT_296177 [Phytophthora sojae]|uniref:Uncharacterized protein n=1 Tax=Phytophthora sojae (strain P6497) TaxID=1094619 RepID=G4YZ74_PHYSP|nr:hypothetical protein PHYSODRAFT_296177 [Phytophthora sojae]EGZ23932.1 hypothetical protein PHYSODRAFT_296177 [Phytophthora sojae]|eukprot:XP_009519220.1 hypothetical protein PHYSODRAFT_296177 [Phytophthora sojae]